MKKLILLISCLAVLCACQQNAPVNLIRHVSCPDSIHVYYTYSDSQNQLMKTHIYQYDEQKRVTHQTIYSDFYENRPYTETQIENTYNTQGQLSHSETQIVYYTNEGPLAPEIYGLLYYDNYTYNSDNTMAEHVQLWGRVSDAMDSTVIDRYTWFDARHASWDRYVKWNEYGRSLWVIESKCDITYNSNAQIEKVVALNGSTTYYYDQYGNDTLCVNTSKGTERTTYTYDKKGNILVKQTEYERHVYYY